MCRIIEKAKSYTQILTFQHQIDKEKILKCCRVNKTSKKNQDSKKPYNKFVRSNNVKLCFINHLNSHLCVTTTKTTK